MTNLGFLTPNKEWVLFVTFICGGWKPYLTFDFVLTTHQFNPTPFFREYQDRKIVRDKVWELHNKGWGYTKIHHYLVENNFKIGKNRTTTYSMIKKRMKREKVLNQPIVEKGFKDFKIEFFKK